MSPADVFLVVEVAGPAGQGDVRHPGPGATIAPGALPDLIIRVQDLLSRAETPDRRTS